jgi:hypothetical protein
VAAHKAFWGPHSSLHACGQVLFAKREEGRLGDCVLLRCSAGPPCGALLLPTRVRAGAEDGPGISLGAERAPLCGRSARHREARIEGAPVFVRRNGWTLVSMWDRSGDRRPGSHATFALGAELSDTEALAECKQLFPEVFTRIERQLGKPGVVVQLQE